MINTTEIIANVNSANLAKDSIFLLAANNANNNKIMIKNHGETFGKIEDTNFSPKFLRKNDTKNKTWIKNKKRMIFPIIFPKTVSIICDKDLSLCFFIKLSRINIRNKIGSKPKTGESQFDFEINFPDSGVVILNTPETVDKKNNIIT